MTEADIKGTIEKQRAFFSSGATKDISFRKEQLRKLSGAVKKYEGDIFRALRDDLKRPEMEAFLGETMMVEGEIDFALRNLHHWMKPRGVHTPLMHQPGSSTVHPEPYGLSLIIAPWNYPFQLLFGPLVGSVAAGNCAVLKPSEMAQATSSLASALVQDCFSPEYIAVIEGDVQAAQSLLEQKFDYIFYTGSTSVGRLVMEAAAKNLTPVTLELGGKSPCIVDRCLHLQNACRRIAWGKFFNAGQTCVAPDYLLVREDMKDEVLKELKAAVRQFYGEDPQKSPHYGRIINDRHFLRLRALLESGTIVTGGAVDQESLYVAPTILDDVRADSSVMEEEIFGPLLPVLTYGQIGEAIDMVKSRPSPLALYLFSEDENTQNRVIAETSSGGICINDTIVHISTMTLPFGGIGESGMGAYHGRAGFDTFSHRKSVMKRSLALDPPLRYPPYGSLTPLFKGAVKSLA